MLVISNLLLVSSLHLRVSSRVQNKYFSIQVSSRPALSLPVCGLFANSKDNQHSHALFVAVSRSRAVCSSCGNLINQTLSGTGACRVAGELFNRFRAGSPIYLPSPTWGNHIPIFKNAGLDVRKYRYYDPNTMGLDFGGECYGQCVRTVE